MSKDQPGVLVLPAFYLLGQGIDQVSYLSFERRGSDSLRGHIAYEDASAADLSDNELIRELYLGA